MEKGIHRRTLIEPTPALALRFWRLVEKSGSDDCWRWKAALRSGYGCLNHGGKLLSAHCIAYTLAKGSIPDGAIVMHSCDNRWCCNPAHLEAGTPRQNFLDGVARGRIVHARGERIWNSKLNPELVLAMRAKHAAGQSIRSIGREFGINDKTAGKAIRGETWSHVS